MSEKRKERPGVMLYFDDIRPAINRLDPGQSGALLRSILDYAQYGAVPELDPMTSLVFEMLMPKLDRDAERYEESREQRQYAVYAREKKKMGESCLSFAEWRLMRARSSAHENNGPISPDPKNIDPYPSASASVSTSAAATTTAAASASPSKITSSPASTAGEGCKGEEASVERLHEEWLKAMDAKNLRQACDLSDRLFARGYYTDIATRKLIKRPTLPGLPRT